MRPLELLDACKEVEREVGRAAGGPRHGPRVIDVDVLLLGDLEYESERLTLPHRAGHEPPLRARAAARARPGSDASTRRAACRLARRAGRWSGGSPRRTAARHIVTRRWQSTHNPQASCWWSTSATRRRTLACSTPVRDASPSIGASPPCAIRPPTSSAPRSRQPAGAARTRFRRHRRLDRLLDRSAALRAVDCDGASAISGMRCSASDRRSRPACRSAPRTRTRSGPIDWSTRWRPTTASSRRA